jgi:hypothetical protein
LARALAFPGRKSLAWLTGYSNGLLNRIKTPKTGVFNNLIANSKGREIISVIKQG